MKKQILELDDINKKIREVSFDDKGTITCDKKWLVFFDSVLVDLIETKKNLDFANGASNKWEIISNVLKSTKD